MLSPFMGKISVKLACFSRDCSVKPSTLGPYWKSLTHIEKRGRERKYESSRFDSAKSSDASFPFNVLGVESMDVEGFRDVL